MKSNRASFKLTTVFLLSLLLSACAGTSKLTVPTGGDVSVSIMAFNVENLFDTKDDEGKNDETYLPLSQKTSAAHIAGCEKISVERWRDQCLYYDWNDRALRLKMEAVARAILQFDNGRGPDIVALQEIENLSVLEQLRTGYLADAGYRPAVLIDGNDLRGIDVAFLSRLEVVGEPVLHDVSHPDVEQSRVNDTRGILEATFRLPDGSLLTGFAVHFPAPFHPAEMREQAYDALNALYDNLPEDRAVFAAGDFNTPAEEDAERGTLDRFVRSRWVVTHEYCEGCPGTHFYPPKGWSFLDMILWSPGSGEKTTWRLRENEVRLVNEAMGQTTADGVPDRFELPAGTGISDHWPLAITIELEPKQ